MELSSREERRAEIVRESERRLGIEHKDGIPWNEAGVPPWDHECWVQTKGYLRVFELVERCPCGGVRMGGYGPWIEVNQTRIHRGETPPRRSLATPKKGWLSWLRH